MTNRNAFSLLTSNDYHIDWSYQEVVHTFPIGLLFPFWFWFYFFLGFDGLMLCPIRFLIYVRCVTSVIVHWLLFFQRPGLVCIMFPFPMRIAMNFISILKSYIQFIRCSFQWHRTSYTKATQKTDNYNISNSSHWTVKVWTSCFCGCNVLCLWFCVYPMKNGPLMGRRMRSQKKRWKH